MKEFELLNEVYISICKKAQKMLLDLAIEDGRSDMYKQRKRKQIEDYLADYKKKIDEEATLIQDVSVVDVKKPSKTVPKETLV